MAVNYNPKIVTDGLVMCLDAANPKSYPGTGTTWFDLTGNGNSVSAINSPTWNSSGFFETGNTGYFSGAGTSSIPIGNSTYAMSCWVRYPTIWTAPAGIISIGSFAVATNKSNALRTLGALGTFRHYWWSNDLDITNNNGGIAVGKWFSVIAQHDGSTRSVWVNGINVGSDSQTTHDVTTSTIQVAKTFDTEYLKGQIACAMIYNRALSASEIAQNFNATRGRFGI